MASPYPSRHRRWLGAGVGLLLGFVGTLRSDTYMEWKARVFTEAEQAEPNISGETALSPAGDGIPNLMKYAFGIDPHVDGSLNLPRIGSFQSTDPLTGLPAVYPTISYQVASTNAPSDLHFVPELSFDLQSWTRGIGAFNPPESATNTLPPGTEQVTVRALRPLLFSPCDKLCPTSGFFLRLRVIEGTLLPDDWQIANFGQSPVDPNADPDGDGVSTFDEFLNGTDPNDYYNGRAPTLEIVRGDRQRGFPSRFLPFALVVKVTQDSRALINAPVHFSIAQGGASQLAASPDSPPGVTADVRTDGNGFASIYLFLGAASNVANTVEARAAAQVATFTEISISSTAPKVAAGDYHSMALDADGSVWVWGDNSYGQLGDGTYDVRTVPLQLSSLAGGADIAAGPEHSSVVKTDGTVWEWGANGNGQLGDGTNADRQIPAPVAGFIGALAVSAGSYHTVVLRSDGTVWAWGYNGDGELGHSDSADSNVPVEVVTASGAPLQRIIAIASGYFHNIALREDGTVWAWGANWNGMLGDGTTVDRHYAVQVPGLTGIKSVKTGAYHSLALGSIGPPLGPSLQAKKTLSLGASEPANAVWTWGANFSAQLGNDTFDDSSVPVAITSLPDAVALAGGYSHSLVLRADGTVWGWGSDSNGQVSGESSAPQSVPVPIAGLSAITSVAAGSSHSLALSSNGLIYAWGNNAAGELGTGQSMEESPPIATAKDSRHSGMPDSWQYEHFGRTDVDPNGDEDGDGLTNLEEFKTGTSPDNSDSDGDSVPDGEDGWPLDPDLHPPRLPEYHYAIVDLGEGAARAINNHNTIVGDLGRRGFIWKSGVRQDLPERGDHTTAVDINDSGVALFNSGTDFFNTADVGPAIWVEDHFVGLSMGLNSDRGTYERRVVGWDPNIVWVYTQLFWSTSAGINNSGQIAVNIRGGSSHIQFPKNWPVLWSNAESHAPVPLSGTIDANDRALNVNDSQDQGFAKDYQRTAQSFDFGGHYDNRLGVDNNIGVVAINNAGQALGGCEHFTGLTSFGFPASTGSDGTSPPQRSAITFWDNGVPEEVATGNYKSGQALNDDGIIVGADVIFDNQGRNPEVHEMLWIKIRDEWKEKDLGVTTWHDVQRVNRNIQIIAGDVLYQNGHATDLYTRIPPGYSNLRGLDINEDGLIVGQADIDAGNGPIRTHAILLVPAELMVDGNRDGQLSFSDASIHDKDQTSAERPYRFWLNDDHDVYHPVDGDDNEWDDLDDGSKDCDYTSISTARDLEDFTRLRIRFAGLAGLVNSPDYAVYLEWRGQDGTTSIPAADGAPGINIYQEHQPDVRALYLESQDVAQKQLETPYDTWIGAVRSGQAMDLFGLRPALRSALSEESPDLNLLFCGKTAGRGQLIVTIKKGDRIIVQYPPVYLDLREVKDLYERWTVGEITEPNASVVSSLDYRYWPSNSATALGNPVDPPPDEAADYILWVHGWNMSPFDKDSYADTAFKRLFWQGYKGRFGTFRWPTFYFTGSLPPVHHFDASEHRAWASSLGLLSLINHLNTGQFEGKVRLVAHSLGNVVASEALRRTQGSHLIHTYVASQAAFSAHCYDSTSPMMGFQPGFGPTTPDIYGHYWQDGVASQPHQWQMEGRPSYMSIAYMIGKAGRYFNYYNDADFALNAFHWQADQMTKPDAGYGYEYAGFPPSTGFWRDAGFGATWLTFPIDRHEIMAWVAESQSYALGAQWVGGAVTGSTGVNRNLRESPFGYGSEHKYHSGQFRGTNMQRAFYWEQLLLDFSLKGAP